MEQKVLNIINMVFINRGRKVMPDLNPAFHLRNDLGFDSLDLAELTVRIEAEFDIDIFDDSVPATIEEVLQKLGKK